MSSSRRLCLIPKKHYRRYHATEKKIVERPRLIKNAYAPRSERGGLSLSLCDDAGNANLAGALI